MPDDDPADAAAARETRDRRVSSARMQAGMGACLALLGVLALLAASSVPEGVSLFGPGALTAVGVAVVGHAAWRLRRLR